MATSSAQAGQGLSRLRQSFGFRTGARVGYLVAGLLHILIGILAITVALGGGGQADQSGALATIAQNPGGALLLWIIVVGLVALGLWQVLEALTVSDPDRKKRVGKRVKEAGKAIAYLAIGLTALRFATGGGESSEQSAEGAAAGLLASPLGVAAVLAVALIAIGIGVAFIASGVRKKFLEHVSVPPGGAGRAVPLLGQVGYVAKGVAVVVIGLLFGAAAFTHDPNRAGGLDGALKALAALPFGVVVLVVVGLGFVAYGLFFFVRAWRPRF
ncbi:DUF1206 domain-containing protein [Naasia sp. SYSU D00948]|uniref:DUF1206 domain-containing protein n=1 Tax=Naasia sp. SYSU D00948 TaxID=2817379 RepID=UPI001B30764E|nr:DUF1206 domain-containing protein [Naasia sp. SYSU D00948]